MTTPARSQVPASPSSPRKLRGSSQGRSFSDPGMSLLMSVQTYGFGRRRTRDEKKPPACPRQPHGGKTMLVDHRGAAQIASTVPAHRRASPAPFSLLETPLEAPMANRPAPAN